MLEICLTAASLPMGDDTPIWLYALLGGGAVAALVVVSLMGKKQKGSGSRKQPPQKRP